MTDVPRVTVKRVGNHRVSAVSVIGAPAATGTSDFATQAEVIAGVRGDVVVSPSTLNGSRPYRDVRSFAGVSGDGVTNDAVGLQTAFNSGLPLIVPKGVKCRVASQLIIPTGLDLIIDGRIERTWNGGGSGATGAMFIGANASNVHIRGTGTVGAQSLSVGSGQVFNGSYNDTVFEGFGVDTWWGGLAYVISGNRLRMDRVTIRNTLAATGNGGIRYLGGDDFVAYGCHVESGDDALQFVPAESGVASPPTRRGAYIGCTGYSTAARFIAVGSGGTNPSAIEDCSFVGCHGKASNRGIVITVKDTATGPIRRLSVRDCSVDCSTDIGIARGGLYVTNEQTTGSAVMEDITIDNVTVISPMAQAATVERVNRVVVNNCTFEASRTPFTSEVAFTNCPDMVFTNNTVKGSGTVAAVLMTTGTGGPELACNRALVADNSVVAIASGAYGIEGRAGTDILVRRNRLRSAPTVTAAAGVRFSAVTVLPRIEFNHFTDLVATTPISIAVGVQAYIYENVGIPTIHQVTTPYNIAATDDRSIVEMNNPAPRTITFLGDAKNALPLGEYVDLHNVGAGTLTAAGEAGIVTLTGPATIETGQSMRVVKTAPNAYMTKAWSGGGGGGGTTTVASRVDVRSLGILGDGSNEATALQTAFNSGVPLIVPKGLKVTVGAALNIPSGLDLIIDGRIERNWNGVGTGAAAAMFQGSALDVAAVRRTNVHIGGNGSVGAVSTTVGTGPIFVGGFDDSSFVDISVDIWALGVAFFFTGHRIRMENLRTRNGPTIVGQGAAFRFFGGDDLVVSDCHFDAADDCYMIQPGDATASLAVRRAQFLGCTGRAAANRMISVISSGTNATNIEGVSFIGCRGTGALRGISVFTTGSATGAIRRVSFRDCAVDTTADVSTTTRGTFYVSHDSTSVSATVEDITFDNVSAISPSTQAAIFARVNRLIVNGCTFQAPRAPFTDSVRLTDCPDAIFTNNTVAGSGTIAAVLVFSDVLTFEAPNRARIEDNQILGVTAGAYGVEIRHGSDVVVRRNRFRNTTGTAAAAVRVAPTGPFPRIEFNDMSGLAATTQVLVGLGVQAYVYGNKGVPPVWPITGPYTIDAIDDRRLIEMNATLPRVVTFLLDSKTSLPIGEWVELVNVGTATWTLSGEVGVTMRGTVTVPTNGFAHVIKTAANTYFSDLGSGTGGTGGTSNAEVAIGPGTPADILPVTVTQLWVDTDDPGIGGGGGGGTVSDATPTTKGIVMLAGDLAGTADVPRVPALLTKSDIGHTHAGGGTGGSGVPETALLSDFAGANDSARFRTACSDLAGITPKPTVLIPAGATLDAGTTPYLLPSGFSMAGTVAGVETEFGETCPVNIRHTGSTTSGVFRMQHTSGSPNRNQSFSGLCFLGTASTRAFTDLALDASQGWWQYVTFNNVSFNGFDSIYHGPMLGFRWYGQCYLNNFSCNRPILYIGGSDNGFWTDGGFCECGNIGTYANAAANAAIIRCGSLTKTDFGQLYITGSPTTPIRLDGGEGGIVWTSPTIEGRPQPGGGPRFLWCAGELVRLTGGSATFRSKWWGFAMRDPAATGRSPGGFIHISGGDHVVDGGTFQPYTAGNYPGSVIPPFIYITGGHVRVSNITLGPNAGGVKPIVRYANIAMVDADSSVTLSPGAV